MGLLGSIAGAVGGLFGAITGRSNASHASDLQRDNWIYQQSNAHQLEVQDLRNAGLNPILSATNSQMAGMGSAPSTSDNGVGSAVTNAITNLQIESMRKEVQEKGLDIENKKVQNEIARLALDDFIQRERLGIDKDISVSTIALNKANQDYVSAKSVSEAAESAKRIEQMDNDMRNANILTEAQRRSLLSGEALNYETAKKVAQETSKVVHETYGVILDNEQLEKILSDPREKIVRKRYMDALEGNNNLDKFIALGLIGKELNTVFPSRIGIGFARPK